MARSTVGGWYERCTRTAVPHTPGLGSRVPRTRLIVNPVAGRDTAPAHLPDINERLRTAFGDVDIVMTVGGGDAERAARQAAADGYERLIVVGGDGTLNEALNGAAAVERLAAVTFGIVPLGTGNDFASALGIGDVTQALDAIVDGRPRQVDLGALDGRVFVNSSAGGFVAEVSEALTPELKTLAGRFAFVLAGAGVLLDYDPVPAAVTLEGRPEPALSGALQMFVVCNGPTIGGGRPIAPMARLDDGELDVVLVRGCSTPEFVALLRRITTGEHVDDPLVDYRRATSLEIAFARTIPVNTDGEVLERQRCQYRVLPGGLRVLAPLPQAR
jgi:diacylglycerol kinase (ATP)